MFVYLYAGSEITVYGRSDLRRRGNCLRSIFCGGCLDPILAGGHIHKWKDGASVRGHTDNLIVDFFTDVGSSFGQRSIPDTLILVCTDDVIVVDGNTGFKSSIQGIPAGAVPEKDISGFVEDGEL